MFICRYKYCDNETHSEYIHYCSMECNSRATGYLVIDNSITEDMENEEESVACRD